MLPWIVGLSLVVLGAGAAATATGVPSRTPVTAGEVEAEAAPADPTEGDAAAEEAERIAADRQAEEERAAEEAERAAADRAAAEQAEAERAARAAAEAARVEEERLEAERRAEEARAAEEARQALLAAQERLVELGYLVGAVDGEQGQQTTAALMAFQAVNGIQVDGILGPETTATLAEPLAEPVLRDGPATRLEVDLDRQVLHLVEGGTRVVTLKVSSGNGAEYPTLSGGTARARTPVGSFTIERRIAGLRESSSGLGTLYDPMYYYKGFAIHGSNSVPAGPASHGCVRVSRADAIWLFDRVPNGTSVVLYGGQHTFSPN